MRRERGEPGYRGADAVHTFGSGENRLTLMRADEMDLERILGANEATLRAPAYRAHAIIVAGMHRSGTSAMTRVLGLRGIDLPRHLAPGIPNNNDLGFWESVPIAEAHDRFLASVGSAWDDVSPIAESAFSSARAREFVEELVGILRGEYGDSSLFVVKDPRLCRLIRVWGPALERFGARPSFVITTRNPLEVAGSLRARDGFNATKSFLLWLRHVLDTERDTRGFPRVFVSYEQLLRDWVSTTDRIARELNLFWPRSDHETNLQIEEFLSDAFRHHSFQYSELRARSDVTQWVKDAFDAITRAEDDSGDVDRELFDDIRAELDRADQAYGPLLAWARNETTEREAARAEVEARLAALAAELAEQQDELTSVRADSQLVTDRLAEEIEVVGRLGRIVDSFPVILEELGRAFGEASAEMSVTDSRPLTVAVLSQALLGLRHHEAVLGEAEPVRLAVEAVIAGIEEFLAVLDDDRARLQSALAESEERQERRIIEIDAFRLKAQQAAETLALRESELTGALRRAGDAEARASTREETLRVAVQEREQLADETARLSSLLRGQEEALAHRTREYETVRVEAQQLAAAVVDAETQLEESLRSLDSAVAEVGQLRETLAERESRLSEALAHLNAVETASTARTTKLEEAVAERDQDLAAAYSRLDTAEERLREVTAELDQIRFEGESWFAEAKRLSSALDDRDIEFVELHRTLDAQQAALVDARLELELVAGTLESAHATRDAEAGENERLKAALSEQSDAIAMAHAESGRLELELNERQERLELAFEEARKLATALAEREDALVHRSSELQEREEQLRGIRSQLAARDELLVNCSHEIEGLRTDLRIRDEALTIHSQQLAHLAAIGRTRKRRWRSVTQFCSWLLPPTAEHRAYIKAYLHLRRSDRFDSDYYLSQYLDVSHTGLNPLMHYVEHGRREGRMALGPTDEAPRVVAPAVSRVPARLPAPEPRQASPRGGGAATLHRALAERARENAVVAVASGGEDHQLALSGYRTLHFPATADGTYCGDHVSGDTALIANLEATRAAGAEFLYVPPNHGPLLEDNPRFRSHLVGRYARVLDSERFGALFALDSPAVSQTWRRELADLADWIERDSGREISILDWDTGLRLETRLHGYNVFSVSEPELPHLDASVDVVAAETRFEERLAEAARVARHGVLEVAGDGSAPRLTTSDSFVEHAPTVTIVIPCHEEFAHTQACVIALSETLPTWFRGEILIVDDASTSGTVVALQELADSCSHVRLLRNSVNSGFLASVNRAVGEAENEFVVLLNNDTIPLPGWLPPLLAPLIAREDVGAVGGRLVYPDGRLQEAGGLVFRDGSAAKFGYGDPDPDFPLFTVPREVDYCSGCLLAFRRELFLEAGGFDPAYGFGFYEDTDFCFRVRSLGRVVLYEPESVIVHVEGASAGRDLTQGAKRFQAINASLFTERWQGALAHQHERPVKLDRKALQRLAQRLETA